MNDDRDAWLDEVKRMVFGDKLPAHMRPQGAASSPKGTGNRPGQVPESDEVAGVAARSPKPSALVRVRAEGRRSSVM